MPQPRARFVRFIFQGPAASAAAGCPLGARPGLVRRLTRGMVSGRDSRRSPPPMLGSSSRALCGAERCVLSLFAALWLSGVALAAPPSAAASEDAPATPAVRDVGALA